MRQPLSSAASGATRTSRRPASTIIFDKDGTLLDAHKLWGPIVSSACSLMPEEDEVLFRLLGYDSATGTFTPTAPFMIEPNSVVYANLQDAGIDADVFFAHLWAQPTPSAPIMDTQVLFARCRTAGLHVGVLTSDDRQSALNFLEQEGVKADAIVCGDDGRGQKPSAEPLLALASDLNVDAASMVMVGDSTHDIDCGKAAGALTVGVLTGVGGHSELGSADMLLRSVADIDHAMLADWASGSPHELV